MFLYLDHVTPKGAFTPVDRLLCSETGIKIITMLLFILGCGSLSHGKVFKRTKCVNTSHARVNRSLIGQSSTVSVPGLRSGQDGTTTASTVCCCFVFAVIIKRYNFEQESRIHQKNLFALCSGICILKNVIRKWKSALWCWMAKTCSPTDVHRFILRY